MSLHIVSRNEWGADPPDFRVSMPLPQDEVWVHHTGDQVPQDDDGSWAKAYCRGVQDYHMRVKEYSDIAYSWLISPGGLVYQGRGWGVVGGHTYGRNDDSHGICFMGNFEVQKPTREALDAFIALVVWGTRIEAIVKVPKIDGHRKAPGASTACPGKNLYARLDYLREGDDMTPKQEEEHEKMWNFVQTVKQALGVGFEASAESVIKAVKTVQAGVAPKLHTHPGGDGEHNHPDLAPLSHPHEFHIVGD